MTPLVVVEGSDVTLGQALHEVAADGWTSHAGFAPPFRSGKVVRTGVVDGPATAEAALLAALAGQGLVVRATAGREVIDRLIDDLRRLGPVDYRIGTPAPLADVGPEARALLGLLAEGHTLGESARLVGVSRRTADRRVADARRALGVHRTTEAVALARRLGWLGAGVGAAD